jgi:hypothetical protein
MFQKFENSIVMAANIEYLFQPIFWDKAPAPHKN